MTVLYILYYILAYIEPNFQVRHPRCVKCNLKCNIKYIYNTVTHNFISY
jgi:hypothetical protein